MKNKKPWITDEQKKDLFDIIEEVKEWIDEQVKKQAESPLNEDPIFKKEDLLNKIKKIESIYTKVEKTPKPK